jgi:rare lipoprotein A
MGPIRFAFFFLALALAGSAPVLAEDAGRPRHERISSWTTVVTPEPATHQSRLSATPARPSAGPSSGPVTAALQSNLLPRPDGQPVDRSHELTGLASFYWQGQKTANGEEFDKTAMTAAHRTLPFNTRVRVTHLANGRSVIVRINDRGPFKPGRVIDLSHAAAGELNMHGQGLARVKIDVVEEAPPTPVKRLRSLLPWRGPDPSFRKPAQQ